jgi:L-ascorbate 6-phosphate lactonase
MVRLADEIRSAVVAEGSVCMWWLGQAGFAFKTHDGKVIFLDPYLSDAAERLFGFKRLSLTPIIAEEVQCDFVVMTHEHADHLDPDAVPIIAKNNPQCRFVAPAGCDEGLTAAGVSPERRIRLEANRSFDLGSVTIHTAPADHGDISATALTLLMDFSGIRIMASGDTSLRTILWQPLLQRKPDVILPCINGVFGNMNHIDAARLIEVAKPRYAIPCHFWTFAEQGGGDPAGFIYACRQFCPEVKAILLRPAEAFTIQRGTA